MAMRSWLFVPGDSENKLAKAKKRGADMIIVDLEDAVAKGSKRDARELTTEWLKSERYTVLQQRESHPVWVRINALDTPYWREDLVSVMQGAPNGIIIPKVQGPLQLQTLNAEIYEHEQRNGMLNGSVQVIPFVGETAASALTIPSYLEASIPRLGGFAWGAEDLASAVSASRKRDAQGQWTDAMRFVRAQVLLAAHARDVVALDTVYGDYKDLKGLKKVAEDSAADGFTGMLAIHPDQVEIINEAFTPSSAQIAEAREIVNAFRENPDAGALAIDGRLVEKPHYERAKRLLGFEEPADMPPGGRVLV
jgi:citrate lyase subunit beta/citryl-CoA lyase